VTYSRGRVNSRENGNATSWDTASPDACSNGTGHNEGCELVEAGLSVQKCMRFVSRRAVKMLSRLHRKTVCRDCWSKISKSGTRAREKLTRTDTEAL
jgi:hypothetical protein